MLLIGIDRNQSNMKNFRCEPKTRTQILIVTDVTLYAITVTLSPQYLPVVAKTSRNNKKLCSGAERNNKFELYSQINKSY